MSVSSRKEIGPKKKGSLVPPPVESVRIAVPPGARCRSCTHSTPFFDSRLYFRTKMRRKRAEQPQEPTHEEVKARNPLKNKNINNYNTMDALANLCSAVGLETGGTKEKLKKDLETFKRLDWGGSTKKVTVAPLRGAQGPSSIWDDVEHTPEAIFDIFFNDEMWNLLVTETNRYQHAKVRQLLAKKW